MQTFRFNPCLSSFCLTVVLVIISFSASVIKAQSLDDPCLGLGLPCNEKAGLACNPATGRCECQSTGMIFNLQQRVCQVSAGFECDSSSELSCIEDASCVHVEGRNNQECACNENFESIAARSCDGVGNPTIGDENILPHICCPTDSDSSEN